MGQGRAGPVHPRHARGEGLRPAPDADRDTWLRRVAIDLVGLPPSTEQIVGFINDPSPQAGSGSSIDS